MSADLSAAIPLVFLDEDQLCDVVADLTAELWHAWKGTEKGELVFAYDRRKWTGGRIGRNAKLGWYHYDDAEKAQYAETG